MSIESLLEVEIQDKFEDLNDLEAGTEKYKGAVDGLTKLIDRRIELERLSIETKEKEENRKNDNDFKLRQMKEDKLDRWVRNGIAIAGIIIPSLITIWGTTKSLKFEEKGTVTTIMGRGFINKLLPKK